MPFAFHYAARSDVGMVRSNNEDSAYAGPHLLAANAEIGEQVRDDPKLDGMGTTLIALLRARDKIVLAHIGDSRAFMVRDGVVTQITKDHSFVQNLVDEGRISSSDAHTHPQRSLVTRVLTGAHDDEPDLVVRQGRIGDRYLIASDGLTDYVARDTVTVVVAAPADITGTMPPPPHPQVVGAAAVRGRGPRPTPPTPAAKAA